MRAPWLSSKENYWGIIIKTKTIILSIFLYAVILRMKEAIENEADFQLQVETEKSKGSN